MNSLIINDQLQNRETCYRCKSSKAVIICSQCHPFTHFCSNCDNSIHILPSKQSHQRQPIPLPSQSQSLTPTPSLTQSQTPNEISSNYISSIQDIYQQEKTDLLNRTFSLERQLDSTKDSLTSRISTLHDQIETLQRQKANEISELKSHYEFELNHLTESSNVQISSLVTKQEEAIKINDDLLSKLHHYMQTIESLNADIDQLRNGKELAVKKLQQENKDLIEYYEKKLNYANEVHNEDKGQLIVSYENTIAKMTNEYNESKAKLQRLIKQREGDIGKFIDDNRKENEALNEENITLRKRHEEICSEIEGHKKTVFENKYEIEVLNQKINVLNKEKGKLERVIHRQNEDNEAYAKEIEYLKVANEKLHRITHGIFKGKSPIKTD